MHMVAARQIALFAIISPHLVRALASDCARGVCVCDSVTTWIEHPLLTTRVRRESVSVAVAPTARNANHLVAGPIYWWRAPVRRRAGSPGTTARRRTETAVPRTTIF